MVKVAIAGGAGDLGRHIIDAILDTHKHELIVLSRSPNPSLEGLGVKVVVVSYDDPVSLEAALQGVHTVISVIATMEGPALVASQLALLAAAQKAGVKRFAPGEFGVRGFIDDPIVFYRFKGQVNDAVAQSGLEYTIFENGSFMNYLANGTPGMGYLGKSAFIIDTVKDTVMLPGDGTACLVHTRVEDIAAFVAASLDLPKWPEVSRIIGDRISYNDAVALLEKYKGKQRLLRSCPQDLLRYFGPQGQNLQSVTSLKKSLRSASTPLSRTLPIISIGR